MSTPRAGKRSISLCLDETYGPDYVPLMKAIADLGVSPTIICESDGTMAEDALAMQNEYRKIVKEAGAI